MIPDLDSSHVRHSVAGEKAFVYEFLHFAVVFVAKYFCRLGEVEVEVRMIFEVFEIHCDESEND